MQTDLSLANQPAIDFRLELNNHLETLATLSSGDAAPATTFPFQLWADTTNDVLKIRNEANSAWVVIGILGSVGLGLASLSADQTWTGAQRGTITTDNDGSFDQAASNNFACTPTGAVALTFTNHTAGQSGLVLFVNGSNYAITAAATTYIAAADLTKLSATGTYLCSYISNGTNTYVVVSAALTSAGA